MGILLILWTAINESVIPTDNTGITDNNIDSEVEIESFFLFTENACEIKNKIRKTCRDYPLKSCKKPPFCD